MKKLILLFLSASFLVNAQSSLKDLEEPFTKYRVSTTACSKIIHTSGSIIFIPDHAFAVNTEEVDSVDIFYREMRSPMDMIVHNINMVTELMDKPYYLESNGMFEIYSRHNSDTIEVHEDRSIVVRLAMRPKDIDVSMEGFKYNNETNLWDSYTDRLDHLFLDNNDSDLWGSGPTSQEGGGEFIGEEEAWVPDPNQVRQDSIRAVAFQAMEIFDFGFYNYDKIIQGEVFIPIVASFVDQKNDSLSSMVYVVYEDINSVFYYDEYDWRSGFSLIKDKAYKLFTLDKNGQLYNLRNYPVLSEEEDQKITFTLVNEGFIPDTKSKLSNLTGVR